MCDCNQIICLHIKMHIYAHVHQIIHSAGETVLLALRFITYCCHLVQIIRAVCHQKELEHHTRPLFFSPAVFCASQTLQQHK